MTNLHASLAMTVLERGWLSANQVVFGPEDGATAAVIDSGFGAHAPQTLALVEHVLKGARLGRIVNTHLHSDHCGGNAALQARGGVQTWVPRPSVDIVRSWDEARLSFQLTDQPCPRFTADRALTPGDRLRLGPADWWIHAAPGHDPDAVLLFEPQTRTLISGDALWEERLAIIFPELSGQDGFEQARMTLALIERLAPREVIPGHGRPFGDVAAALAASRQRLEAFQRQPARHVQHAARALLMFRLLEIRSAPIEDLTAWMLRTPIFRMMACRNGLDRELATGWARDHIRRMVDDGALLEDGSSISVRPQAS